MTIHAAGYDRQSEERGNGSTASPATQRAANREEAEKRGRAGADIVWVGHYSEKPGTSAFSEVDRPEFERLLNDCRAGRVNMIIVLYVSRFSRKDPLDAIPVVTELLNLGVTIVSVTEGEFRRGNLMDLIHLIMRLDQAHNESKNKSTAVRGAHDLARSLGGFVGKEPYGFEMVPLMIPNPADKNRPVVIQTLAIRKSEAKVIQRVWWTIKAHKDTPVSPKRGKGFPGSLTNICAQLEADKVPTRGATIGKRTANSAWDPTTLKRILRDPRIAGMQAAPVYKTDKDGNPTRSIAGYRILRDPETMEPLTLQCGPIIPRAEWEELQEWLDGRGRGKGQFQGQTLLSAMDILHCESNHVMVGHAKASAPTKSHYQCKPRKAAPDHHTGVITIQCTGIDDFVARRIFALVGTAEADEETLDTLAEATRRFARSQEAPETAGERRSLVAERADVVRALEELYEDRAAGGYKGPIGRKAFLSAEQSLTERLEHTEARLGTLEERSTPALPIMEWLPEGYPDVDPLGPGSWWHGASVDDRRAFVQLFVERVTVHRTNAYRPNAEDRVKVQFVRSPEPEEEDE
ncbi:recombinase family protein [Kitasatospora cathayae]|uniref:Recombinase family protein n=1 Tax=Kitasatospora cathayae TaxID=3004092 RepID=A0ABY7Q3H1_9ACTN|nr:recombinase family protein [Kitasatospora sp. HUAS 3-15]WBP87052.1 recombinase family protein [Kitasatospora sp. HUAS 3-15]